LNARPHTDLLIILLAAGASRRFGDANKLLADIDGDPLAARVARTVRDAFPSARVCAVVSDGDEGRAVSAILKPHVDGTVINPNAHTGLASSLRTGLTCVEPGTLGAMVVQCDMPNLTGALLERLANAFDANEARNIIVPVTTKGAYRTPVVWPARLFDELRQMTGDQGGKPLLQRHADAVHTVPLGDDDLASDIDTQEALAEWRADRLPRAQSGDGTA